MSEMRKQFEEWRVKDVPFSLLRKDERGEYQDIATWLAWRAWQASRAALVVGVSNDDVRSVFLANGFKEKPQPDGVMDLNPYVYDAAFAILSHAAGITVKGEK